MQFVIVTGMSGSGKSCAMNVLEDIGFYCIDNMPPQLLTKFADICRHSNGQLERVAIAVDIRSGEMFSEIFDRWKILRENKDIDVKILYLEANDEIIIKRYKETRRKHPLDDKFGSCLHKAIAFEREQLSTLREVADYYIESSYLSTSQLKEEIKGLFLEKNSDSMIIKVMSFGYKYGVSTEADLVFDVRCLPNPYYIKELRAHTGCDHEVRDYVMSFQQSCQLMDKVKDLLDFLIPLYVHEGKSQLVVCFGCTGGKHRSITFTELISDYLSQKGFRVQKSHRDIGKDISYYRT
ncbi:MAG: RNase adapter RapZ [Oscillospiraceae bacterium]|nr:RNase adapter RapZ [Oscillospiraceae bacterium]